MVMAKAKKKKTPTLDDLVKSAPAPELARMKDLMVELCQIQASMQSCKEHKDEAGAELGAYFESHSLEVLRLEDFLFMWVHGSQTHIDGTILADLGVPVETIEKATVTTPWSQPSMVVRRVPPKKKKEPFANVQPAA